MFLDELPIALKKLKNHIENKNIDEARSSAHDLKNTVAILDIQQAMVILNNMENESTLNENHQFLFSELDIICHHAMKEATNHLKEQNIQKAKN